MRHWIDFLRAGLKRPLPVDPIHEGPINLRRLKWDLILGLLRGSWKLAAVGGMILLVTALLSFGQPLVTRFLVDDVILAKRLDLLVWGVLALVGIKGMQFAGNLAEKYIYRRLQNKISMELQQTVLEHTLQLPKSFFDEREVGYLMSRLVADVQGLNWFFSQSVAYIFSNILRFLGGLVFLFVLEWRLAILALAILPLLALLVNLFSKRIYNLSHYSSEQQASVNARFQETLASIPLIKAFSREHYESERVMEEVETAQGISMEQTVVGSVAYSLISLIPDVAKGIVLVIGAILAIEGHWSLGSLLAFLSYLGFVYGPALALASSNLDLQNALTALSRVSAMLEVVPEGGAEEGCLVEHLDGEIRFENVSFSYDQAENVLENINFRIVAGEQVAIVGPSGVGKTTLISLLMRFYKPTAGEIFFDGQKASEIAIQSLRQRIGYVSQAARLLSGSIRENLLYGNAQASQAELEHAAKVAGILEFIQGLTEQFETPIGENGVNLSEGQKQRLAIARALVRNPDILIMDEPSSALDSQLEKSIFETIPAMVKGKTLIIVAHRLPTMQLADRILVLNEKNLVVSGTHQELYERSPYYRSMVESQRRVE